MLWMTQFNRLKQYTDIDFKKILIWLHENDLLYTYSLLCVSMNAIETGT